MMTNTQIAATRLSSEPGVSHRLPKLRPAIRFQQLPKRLTKQGLVALVTVTASFAQNDPWTQSATNLKTAFTGPIASALILVAIVIAGLMFAFGESGSKKLLSGLVFGGGMALGAVRFVSWLYS